MIKNNYKILHITGVIIILILTSFIPQISGEIIQNNKQLSTQNKSTWMKTYGSSSQDEYGDYILETDDNGFLILATKQIGLYADYNIWLIKTDSNGNIQWEKEYIDSVGNCLKTTKDGGYIIAGTDKQEDNEALLIKVDNLGNLQWKTTFVPENSSYGHGLHVIQTDDNGYLLTGEVYLYDGNLGTQIYIAKVDSNGNFLWDNNFGRDEYFIDSGSSSCQTDDGGYMVTGDTTLDSSGWTDVVLIKTDDLGNQRWLKTFPTSSQGLDLGKIVIKTDEGGYLLTAEQGIRRYGTVDWDIWLIKTDRSGNLEWEKLIGRRFSDSPGSNLFKTKDNSYLTTGAFELIKDEELGVKDDICLIKFDKNGDITWDTFFPSDGLDWGECVIETSDEAYIIVGSVEQSINADKHDLALIKTYAPLDYKPLKPNGMKKGKVEVSYEYTSTAAEPSGKDIYYLWDWGDGYSTGWLGPYSSGESCTVSHTWVGRINWDGHGTYSVRVKVKNEDGIESRWSDPLLVVMPKNKPHNILSLFYQKYPKLNLFLQRFLILQ